MKVDNHNQMSGYAIYPKMDCPHLTPQKAQENAILLNELTVPIAELKCKVCSDQTQNWVCLTCKEIFCSRYVKEHMVAHNSQTGHQVALSFTDGSYWCYSCESYVDSIELRPARKALTEIKVKEEAASKGTNLQEIKEPVEGKLKVQEGQEDKEKNEDEEEKKDVSMLEKMFKFLGVKDKEEEPKKTITLDQIVKSMKSKEYKRVVALTGAGLSVAAGIPDFRSPGTGLYSKLASFNLPYPQAIFEINYYKNNPKAFLALAKDMLSGEYEPTAGHHFIKKLNDQGMLHMNLTQNIDDLEVKAGLPVEKLIQAHGHARSAHCIKCNKEADIKKWKDLAAMQQPMTCPSCEQGLIKPDIVFFGQSLPSSFFAAPQLVGQCDLAIIIGTSLKVMPFAYMAQLIPPTTPILLINRENVMPNRENTVWLEGDIQDNVKDIMKRLEW